MRALSAIPALALLFLTVGCGPAPAWFDGEDMMFDPDWIIEVDIEVADEDWEVLRHQTRNFQDVLCAVEPPPNPFTYFEGDIVIDGMRVESVGVRKKCFFGSCDSDRPSFKVSFNQYVRGQRFMGLRRFTLNNAKSDPAKIKQCLGYWLFDRAGVISPRCSFAHVTVNGVDKGLYVHVESIKTEMISRYFDDTRGNIYEGALSDFQPNWVNTFQKKTNEENPDRSDLDAMVNACAAPDNVFEERLSSLIDLDSYYRFWVMEVLIGHWDGYASFNHNNYYIYGDPESEKFHFIPWGIDGILFSQPGATKSVFADAIIPHRLYKNPESQARYLDLLEELIDTVWDEEIILAEIDRMEELITPIADSYRTGELAWLIQHVRDFVVNNPAEIRAELEGEPVPWTTPLSGPPCLRERGSFSGSFSTTWGSIQSADPFGEGTGVFNVVMDDLPVPINFVASVAGLDPNPEVLDPKPTIQILATTPGESGDLLIAAILVINDPDLVEANKSIPINMGEAAGYLFRQDPLNPDNFEVFLLMDGSIVFSQASMMPGQPIIGVVQATITDSGW